MWREALLIYAELHWSELLSGNKIPVPERVQEHEARDVRLN